MVVLLGVSELIVEVGQSWGAAATARYPWICDVQLLDENHLNKYISNFRQIYFKVYTNTIQNIDKYNSKFRWIHLKN